MKAIYINIDPYLQAVVDWLNAGRPGDAPKFSPLPVAVTIPLGESAAICCLAISADDPTGPVQSWNDLDMQTVSVDGKSLAIGSEPADTEGMDILDGLFVPGFSNLAPSAKYLVATVSGSLSIEVEINYGEDGSTLIPFTIPVIVRRETASGPVDLVDFTPPAAAPSAADIKSALVTAGPGALAGVDLGGAILRRNLDESSNPTMVDTAGPLESGDNDILKIGSASA